MQCSCIGWLECVTVMGEYIHKPGGAMKTSDALLDHILSKRNDIAMHAWIASYLEILAEEMLTANESDRTAICHEMLFVIRGE